MIRITVQVEGMMCPKCEEHASNAIRKAFPKVKNVISSHKDAATVILTEEDIADGGIREALTETGYKIGAITREEQKKKKLFGIFG